MLDSPKTVRSASDPTAEWLCLANSDSLPRTSVDNSPGTFVTCGAFAPFARIGNAERKVGIMPLVTVNTGFTGPDGDEEQLTEYFCDSPNCPNIAARVVRFMSEIGECLLLCEQHAGKLRLKA